MRRSLPKRELLMQATDAIVIHDQILKEVGEAAHPHRDKRGPDLENKIC